jgi:benzoyl-CoA reductase/2-hydroxyglutaryl-CoA dehydratase subunit BcrC/BadD/HgdB
MASILYTSPFVPAEWISAYGLQPVRLYPAHAGDTPALEPLPGLCPYARMLAHSCIQNTSARAVVIAATCDQMRRVAELIARRASIDVFLMHIPVAWQSPASFELYCQELRRLGVFIEQHGGTVPSEQKLVDCMLQSDSERNMLRDMQRAVPSGEYAEMVMRWFESGEIHTAELSGKNCSDGIPVLLAGGPLLKDHLAVYDLIEKSGGSIYFDATENGEFLLPAPYDRRAVLEASFTEMASAFFGSIPAVFQRPNSRLYEYLDKKIHESSFRGILLVRYVWCDLWHAEVQRMKEWTKLPVLDIELNDETPGIDERTKTRIQAFIETIEYEK